MSARQHSRKLITDELTTAGIVLLGNKKLQLPKPGQLLAGTNLIFITALEPVSRGGKELGRELAFFGAPNNLQGNPMVFNGNAATIAGLTNWHNHDGWQHNGYSSGTTSYEEALFNGLQDGSAIGKWIIPELPLVNGEDMHRNIVSANENMLVFNQDRTSPFYNSFVTIPDSAGAKWLHSCTEPPRGGDTVHRVHFLDGKVDRWHYKGSAWDTACIRPVVALELDRATASATP